MKLESFLYYLLKLCLFANILKFLVNAQQIMGHKKW
jgi:hypothetical protein